MEYSECVQAIQLILDADAIVIVFLVALSSALGFLWGSYWEVAKWNKEQDRLERQGVQNEK